MSFIDAIVNASITDVFQWGAMLGLLAFAVYEGYTKKGLNGALDAINAFFQLGNNSVTSPPAGLSDSAYKMSDETKECILAKIRPEEESVFLAQVQAMEAANNASYVLTFAEWWFKIDFGQISDFNTISESAETHSE